MALKGTPNVVRRGGTFYFRRAVPRRLAAAIGRRELKFSLSTADTKLARLRSRHLYVASEQLFARLEGTMLTPEIIDRLVRDFYDLATEIDTLNRLSSPPLTPSQHEGLVGSLVEHREAIKSELGRGDFAIASLAASLTIARAGLTVDDLERRQVEQALMRVGLDVLRAAESRLAGDFSYSPTDPLLKTRLPAEDASPSSPNHVVAGAGPDKPRKPGRPAKELTLSQIVGQFLQHQTKGRLWDPQTVAQARKSYEIFQEVGGNKALREYQRSDAARFKETLQDLPANYGKAPEFRGKSIAEIGRIDEKRKESSPRLALRTVKRHFSALSSLFRWAIQEGLADANPFIGFTFPSALRANEQRDMWSEEELKALFTTPVWQGCLSHGRRTTPGSLIIKDEKYWLPLIALYTGLRQEEIAQLRQEDIRKVDGYLVFDINNRPPRKLKNRNAVRKVPVHSRLIALGFIDYAAEQKEACADVLFPNLKPGGLDDRMGHAFSKWFARYRRDLGLYRKGLDFHSFRHTTTTMLQRAGVAIAAIDELTGHATPGETARYSHGLTMTQLADAIERIRYDFLA